MYIEKKLAVKNINYTRASVITHLYKVIVE